MRRAWRWLGRSPSWSASPASPSSCGRRSPLRSAEAGLAFLEAEGVLAFVAGRDRHVMYLGDDAVAAAYRDATVAVQRREDGAHVVADRGAGLRSALDPHQDLLDRVVEVRDRPLGDAGVEARGGRHRAGDDELAPQIGDRARGRVEL